MGDSDENILFVPEPYDDFTPEEAQLQLQTDNFDSQYDDEDEGAWLQLQNVLNNIQQDYNHPLEKREAAFFDPEPTYEYILPEVDTDDFLMTSLVPGTGGDVIIQTEDGFNQDEDRQQPDMTSRDRRTETFPAGSQDDISNYDFEYEDSDGDNQDDDILYYNSDIEPIAVESVFNRMERLDVKKPGPFYSNSPNNFYLDKLLPDDSQSVEDLDEDPGQTEYEYPLLSSQESRDKKGLQAS